MIPSVMTGLLSKAPENANTMATGSNARPAILLTMKTMNV